MTDETTNLSPFDAARILATLLVTPDDYLDDYRREIFEGRDVPLPHLQTARELTLVVARLLHAAKEVDWPKLEAGLEALRAEPAEPPADVTIDEATRATAPETVVDLDPAGPAEPATILAATRASAGVERGPALGTPARPSPWSQDAAPVVGGPAVDHVPVRPAAHPAASETLASQLSPLAAAPSAPAVSVAPDTAPSQEASAVMARPELPFRPNPAAPPPPPVAAALDVSPSAGETVDSGQLSPLASMGPMFLQQMAAKAEVVELTIEQYASLHAMLEVQPAERQATLESFGVANEPSYRALRDHWTKRLGEDASLEESFAALVEKYAAWIRSQPR